MVVLKEIYLAVYSAEQMVGSLDFSKAVWKAFEMVDLWEYARVVELVDVLVELKVALMADQWVALTVVLKVDVMDGKSGAEKVE